MFNGLKTKFHIPLLGAQLVERPQLFSQLDLSLKKSLTLISAPAGFGKTSLLTQWLSNRIELVAWLSLDSEDNQYKQFWHYFIGAVQSVKPEFGSELHALLDYSDEKVFMTQLINQLSELDTCLVILDDYHLIHLVSIHESMSFLLKHCPASFHLILLSRTIPNQLPINKLRVKQQFLQIGISHLRFKLSELDLFFRQQNISLTEEQACQIATITEGWSLGLQMALLALQDKQDITALITAMSGTNQYIAEFLWDEMFSHLEPDLQRFMMQISILERVNVELSEAVTKSELSQSFLNTLEQKNLFLIPLDSQRFWYRFHHLVSEWLLQQLTKEYPAEVPQLHYRASLWFKEKKLWQESLSHAIKGGHWALAVEILESSAFVWVTRGEVFKLLDYLKQLPDGIIDSSPRLAIYYGWTLVLSLQLDKASDWIQKIEALDLSHSHFPLTSDLYNLKGALGRKVGDLEQVKHCSNKAIQALGKPDTFVLATAHFNLGAAYLNTGNLTESYLAFEQSIPYNLKANNLISAFAAKSCLARILLQQGETKLAKKNLHLVIEELKKNGLKHHSLHGMLLMDLAWLAYYSGELELMETYINDGLELTRMAYNHDSIYGFGTSYQLYLLTNNIEQAKNILHETTQFIEEKKIFSYSPLLKKWQYYLLIVVEPQHTKLKNWAELELKNLEENFGFNHIDHAIWLAKWLLLQKQSKKAEDLLKKSFDYCHQINQMQVLLLWAIALKQRGESQLAIEKVESALILGERSDILRIFIDTFFSLKELVILTLQQSPSLKLTDRYRKQLFENLGLSGAEQFLSQREKELLELIAEGLSNKEIAEKLIVSMNTVKTHLKNLYRKLEASNRTQALLKAKERGLL